MTPGTLLALFGAEVLHALAFLVNWTCFLPLYWSLGFPLGLQAPSVYPAP